MNLRAMAAGVATLAVAAAQAGGPYFYGGHYYDIRTVGGLTWNDARTLAAAEVYNDGSTNYYGYLATITTQEENDFVRGVMATPGYYIGGEHLGGGIGNYGWITGEAWTAFNAGHWAGGEPNGDSGGLQYAWTGEDGFNDLDKDTNHGALTPGYLVEFAAVPEPATLAVLGLGALAAARRRRK